MAITPPPPYPRAPIGEITQDAVTKKPIVALSLPWSFYFRDTREYLASVPVSVGPSAIVALDQNDAIATTSIYTPVQDGLYTFEYYLRVITAAGVSSSATVTLGWTDQGQALTQAFAAITGNTTTTHGWGRYQFQADAGAAITYAVAYASNAANAMHYNFYAVTQSVLSLPESA